MIITVDGPAAAGKGTLSKKVAEKYCLAYFDTGMIYRAVGLMMLLDGYELSDEKKAEEKAGELTFGRMMELSKHKDFRSSKGGKAASMVSSCAGVRAKLLTMQRDFAKKPIYADGTPAMGVIYDGRDTGTVVCPDADIKFFVTAKPEIRAKRRYDEFVEKGVDADYNEVLADVKMRDERDATRKDAPMKPAEDAIIFDTSDLGIDEAFKKMVAIISQRIK